MKVILLQDVKSIGKKGELINASEGYAKNFLLPRKLAVEATNSNLNDLKLKKAAEEKQAAKELEQAQELKAKLEALTVKIPVKTGGNGKLFGAVTNKEIGAALEEQTGLVIDKKKIVLDEQIKMVGTKHVIIKLHPKVSAELKVEVYEG